MRTLGFVLIALGVLGTVVLTVGGAAGGVYSTYKMVAEILDGDGGAGLRWFIATALIILGAGLVQIPFGLLGSAGKALVERHPS